RNFTQLKMHFMGAGLDALSQLAGSMEMAIRRGMAQSAKTRILREAVGNMRLQLEMEQRSVISEEREREAAESGSGEDYTSGRLGFAQNPEELLRVLRGDQPRPDVVAPYDP